MSQELVVDADGHVMEADDLWIERMDHRRWGDWIPRKILEDEVYETVYVGGTIRSGGRALRDEMARKVGMTPRELFDMLESLRVPGGYDPFARIADMDRDGIDVAVLYPSLALFFGPVDPIPALRDLDFVTDCQRAYNEWIAEYCASHPDRLFGIATVPLQDPSRAAAEAERAIVDLGLKGVTVRPSPYIDELPLNHSVYDPFWAACQELDIPVAFHPGVHVDTPGACRKFGLVVESENIMVSNTAVDELHGGSGLGQAVGNTVDMIVTLGRMLMGGVCERFPRLRLLFLEAGGGWIPTQLERMDEQVRAFPLEKRWLSLLPSEYFRRQCWAGFEAEEWNLAACAEWLGVERVLWASDYPHPEFHPEVVKEVRAGIAHLSDADQRRILGQNAVDAYRLPALMELGLEGKVALVTGGSQGIGRAIALTLAAEGADLALCARREEPLAAAGDEVAALGREVTTVVADVATADGVRTVAQTALERFGRVDILVNNAGKGAPKPMLDLTDDDWHASIELNLMSAVRLSLACVPHMQARGFGRIVNISSRVAREPDPFFAPYAAAKAALINFSKNLANAFSADGVLANCVVPGLIRGEGVQQAAEQSAAATGKTVAEVYEATLAKRPIPVGRIGEPSDVAGLVALLVSDLGSWITGACFTVDGGIVRSDR